MQFLLTGARGYIGSRLLDTLLQQGHDVRVLGSVTTRVALGRVIVVPWRLGDEIPPRALAADASGPAIDAVIHLAYDWNALEGDRETNRQGTGLLLAAARAAGVPRFVYVSSMSARAAALNRYGRIKFAVEALLRGPAEVSARVGLVYGGHHAGLYGTLVRLTGLAPALPMVDANQPVQPIHVDEVCSGLIQLATRRELDRPIYDLASDKSIRFGAFLKLLALRWHDRRLLIVPIPRRLAVWLADLSAYLPGVPAVGRERVLGLAGLTTRPTAADLQDIGITVRPVEQRMARSPRHQRIAEGLVLMNYCTGAEVGVAGARLYARCLERLGDSEPLRLPALVARWPVLLRLFDPGQRADTPLARRLILAARIAEAGPGLVQHFHLLQRESRLILLMRLTGLVAFEGLAFGFRLARRIAGR